MLSKSKFFQNNDKGQQLEKIRACTNASNENTIHLYNAVVLKLKLRKLQVTYDTDDIIKFLVDIQPFYDYFVKYNLTLFVQEQIGFLFWYFVHNDLTYIEFLCGKLSIGPKSKYLPHNELANDDVTIGDEYRKSESDAKLFILDNPTYKQMIEMYTKSWFELRLISKQQFLKQRLEFVFDDLKRHSIDYRHMVPAIAKISYHLGFDNKATFAALDIQSKPKYRKFYDLLKNIIHDGCGITNHCGNCQRENVRLKKCSRCKKVSYCSRKCQKTHWNTKHREHCVAA